MTLAHGVRDGWAFVVGNANGGNVTCRLGNLLSKGVVVSVAVRLPTLLRAHTDGEASVSVDGATVGEVFAGLIAKYPSLAGNLLDGDGGLHRFVNVYLDDDDIRYLDQLDTPVGAGQSISILPAVAGG